jgi:hypothetical protein
MTSIIVNEALQAQLRAAEGCVELCGANGRIIGYFTPLGSSDTPPKGPLSGDGVHDPLADLRADFDLVEMERQLALGEKKGIPLAEVYEHLKAITPEPEWRDHLQKCINRLKERDRCDTP